MPPPGTTTPGTPEGARLFVRNPQLMTSLRAELGRRVVAAADVVTRKSKMLLDEPGTGPLRHGQAAPASVPGEPPASQTGELARSQTTRGPFQSGPSRIFAASGSDDPRALWLQQGTAHIAPRPYMLPALLQSAQEIREALSRPTGGGGA